MLPEHGRWKGRHADEKRQMLKMRFRTFVQRFMQLPAQVLTTGRRLVVRMLDWNPWRTVFFRALDAVRMDI